MPVRIRHRALRARSVQSPLHQHSLSLYGLDAETTIAANMDELKDREVLCLLGALCHVSRPWLGQSYVSLLGSRSFHSAWTFLLPTGDKERSVWRY